MGGGEEVRRGGRCGWEAGEGWASVVCMRRVSVIIGHDGEGSTLHEREKPLYTEATGHKGALLRWCFVNFILSVVLFWGERFFCIQKSSTMPRRAWQSHFAMRLLAGVIASLPSSGVGGVEPPKGQISLILF